MTDTTATKGYPAAWDLLDDMVGESKYKQLPEDDYDFKVTAYDLKTSRGGELYAKVEYTITNDTDGVHDGRKVWEILMLEGVTDDGRTKAFNLLNLLKALRFYAVRNQQPLDDDYAYPPYVNAETRTFDSPEVNEDGTKNTKTWDEYLARLVGLHFFARTKHKEREYTKDGETVKVKEDAIKTYIVK